MLNQRSDPSFLKIRELIASGAIGQLQRTNWIMTNWFRPEVYFQSSPWRATWPGEGGGLLVNQCIHNLDLFQWCCGVPSKIRAWCRFGRYHDIEVEDECTAYFEYANGATGIFVGSTGEAPGSNRLEIAGDAGTILLENRVLTLTRNSTPAQAFSRSTKEMFGQPEKTVETFSDWPAVNQHATLLNDFAAGVLDGAKMIAPAGDGLASLEFANGFLLSTWLNREIDLPLDAALYEAELAKRVAASKPRTNLAQAAAVDMSKSYR
jgi:predicted dehydrogenase